MALELVVPAPLHLPSYTDAVRRRWSPNTMRAEVADEELAAIEADPVAFLATKDDLDGSLPPVVQPDGTTRPRLPGFSRWIWDGAFAGSVNARWQPGTAELPAHVLGHVGYSVVPWKRRLGYGTAALGLLLPVLASLDLPDVVLPFVELTTDHDNIGSQRVIEANGGVLVERFESDSGSMLRYRIDLATERGPSGPTR